jgi:hypothetical protein
MERGGNVSETGDQVAISRAHERIDDLQQNVAALVPVVERSATTADKAFNAAMETSAMVREHVAECRQIRKNDEAKIAALTRAQDDQGKESGRRWEWLINAMMVAGALMLWDLAKHILHFS